MFRGRIVINPSETGPPVIESLLLSVWDGYTSIKQPPGSGNKNAEKEENGGGATERAEEDGSCRTDGRRENNGGAGPGRRKSSGGGGEGERKKLIIYVIKGLRGKRYIPRIDVFFCYCVCI